jgi:dipeptidyl aminopeptidase/acylaminoacyl peptidase
MSQPTPTPAPELIPRDILFGNPQKAAPRLSPDGRRLAYLAPDERNVLQVWLRTLGRTDDRVLTTDRKRGIRTFEWTYAEDQLLYLQDAEGDENWHLYSVDVESGEVRDLTPFPGVQARLVALEPGRPHEILAGLNHRNPALHDVYRIDLRSGSAELDTENPGPVVDWTADAEFRIRVAQFALPEGGSDLRFRTSPDGEQAEWETLVHWGLEDDGGAIGFSADGGTLYLAGSHDANTQRVVAIDLSTREQTVLAEDPQYDSASVLFHPVERRVQAVGFVRERLSWELLDPALQLDFARLEAARPGELRIVSRDLEDQTWIAAYVTDDGPVYYHTYYRASGVVEPLFSTQSELEHQPLAAMEPVSFSAQDGLQIHGYLTLPVGLPPERLPTVVLVHGGPWARDTWGYQPSVQWLANRGYAVLQVNFRGSTGYGKAFLHAGDREWGAKMHQDLLDGVEWLAARGIADPARIAIMGGSYGGYAVLAGLTFTPEVFACGVDIVGPSNLLTLMETIPPYWKPLISIFHHRVGHPETEREFLESRSPLFFADRIIRPLLIAQGANDPRVKQAESDQIVRAMRSAGVPVQYLLYTDEGHGFARPENRLHFYARAEEFLAGHLGGRFQPSGEIDGHAGLEV